MRVRTSESEESEPASANRRWELGVHVVRDLPGPPLLLPRRSRGTLPLVDQLQYFERSASKSTFSQVDLRKSMRRRNSAKSTDGDGVESSCVERGRTSHDDDALSLSETGPRAHADRVLRVREEARDKATQGRHAATGGTSNLKATHTDEVGEDERRQARTSRRAGQEGGGKVTGTWGRHLFEGARTGRDLPTREIR